MSPSFQLIGLSRLVARVENFRGRDISSWHRLIKWTSEKLVKHDLPRVRVRLLFGQGSSQVPANEFYIPDSANKAMLRTYARYIAVVANNRFVTLGGTSLELDASAPGLAELVKQHFGQDINAYIAQKTTTKGRVPIEEMMRLYNSRCLGSAEAPSRPAPNQQGSLQRPVNIVALNVGQTRFRGCIVRISPDRLPEIVSPMIDEPTYLSYQLPEGGSIPAPLSQIVWSAKYLTEHFVGRLDGVGVSVAARTAVHQFVDIPLGVVRDFDGTEMALWRLMRDVLSQMYGGVPTVIENDGAAQAVFYSRMLFNVGRLLLLRFGTTLCASVTDDRGWPVEGFGEYNKVIIDPMDRSGDPYYWGRAGKYISFSGINNIAQAMGVDRQYPELAESKIPKRLPEWLGQDDEPKKRAARGVYAKIGAYAVCYIEELRKIGYTIENVALVGSNIAGRPAEIITEQIMSKLRKRPVSVLRPDNQYSESGANIGVAMIVSRLI